MESPGVLSLGAPRWGGQRHRLEVWYATFTDVATGDGYWLHHEVVSPTDESAKPYAHGWLSVFPAGDAASATTERFGPAPPGPSGAGWFSAGDVVVDAGVLRGPSWDLTFADESSPLYTFPRLTWERELLPAAQIVPFPSARFRGQVCGRTITEGRGAVARIYGHGSAERWAWLHADLGGDDVLEVVAAAPRPRGGLKLRPLPVVRLRMRGRDWPSLPLLPAVAGKATVDLPGWTITVRTPRHRLHVEVSIPADRAVALTYVDPDGSTATCTNSERASARISFEHDGQRDEWTLDGTAHAEVGTRP